MWLDPVNVAYLGIGAGFGAVFGGLSQLASAAVRSWLSRRAIARAMVAEVRATCVLAEHHEHSLSDHLLKDWGKQSSTRRCFNHFRTPLWDAGTKELLGLPRAQLERLVAFHAYLASIDAKLDTYLCEQDRLAAALSQENEPWANNIREAMHTIADTSRQMCASLTKCKHARAIKDLPLEYPGTFYRASSAEG